MLQRVMIDGIKLPRLYIAEDASDIRLAKSKGIPYIRWTRGQDALVRMLLRPVLERMFPDIMWSKVLGPRRRFRTMVEIEETVNSTDQVTDVGRLDANARQEDMEEWSPLDSEERVDPIMSMVDEDGTIVEHADATTGERLFHDHGQVPMVEHRKLAIEDYVGDLSSCVNLEVLQRLRLMPAFIGDIMDCVKLNIGSGLRWSEGYNKRLGLPVGRFNASPQLPNLIILDVSGSIPRGISATMISLVDTLRTQLSADLIITSTISRYYPMGSELPAPQRIRDQFHYGNESHDFFGILDRHVRGHSWGHVFSFGDNDTPSYDSFKNEYSLEGTKVEHVHHYHTWADDTPTGYAKWCHMLACQPKVDCDTSWCNVIRR